MLEGKAHKITQRAVQPAIQSYKLLTKFFKLKETPIEFRRGRRCTPVPKNPQQTHRTPAEFLLSLLRKFTWKGKFIMKNSCENFKFKVQWQAGEQYNYHALWTAAKVLEDCTEKWKERGGLMKPLPTKKMNLIHMK